MRDLQLENYGVDGKDHPGFDTSAFDDIKDPSLAEPPLDEDEDAVSEQNTDDISEDMATDVPEEETEKEEEIEGETLVPDDDDRESEDGLTENQDFAQDEDEPTPIDKIGDDEEVV